MPKRYLAYTRADIERMTLDQATAALNHDNAVTGERSFYENAYRELFVVNIVSERIRVWDVTGCTKIGDLPADNSAPVLISMVEALTTMWTNGYVMCSECGALMRRNSDDIAARYLAGTYCKACAPKYERLKRGECD